MRDLIERIEQADDRTISRIIQAVIRRYGKLYPDQEIVFLSLPVGEQEERLQVLRHALEALGMEGE